MAILGSLPVFLFFVLSPVLSFPESEIPNVEPEFLDTLLENEQYELFSELMKIEDVGLVRPGERERSLNPLFHKELQLGDILLTNEQKEMARQGLNFELYPGNKWEDGQVPYAISRRYTSSQRRRIKNGIQRWNEQVSCLQFIPRSGEEDYVLFFSGEGCYSYMGKIGGQQPISLQSRGCLSQGTVLHEMEHAAGVAHEQNRIDRDDYIEMLWDNIPDEWKSQYEKTSSPDFGLQGQYDYYSIMHYDIAAPRTGKPAFRVKQDGIDEDRIGRGDDFTPSDLQKMEELYC